VAAVTRAAPRRRARRSGGRGVVVAAALAVAPRAALAVDAFEIQVYDGTANPAGDPGLELHVNDVVRGLTTAPAPELAPNHQAHFTLEPSYGVTPYWELGGYLQSALRADGAFDFAGAKLRSKLVTTRAWSSRARLGINVEVSGLPRRYEADGWAIEVRPIVAYDLGPVRLAANPIVDVSLTGAGASFEPAAQALYEVPGAVSVGLEYYAGLGGLVHLSPVRAQEHYLYEVVNLLRVRSFELNVGVGEGLTSASNALVAKLILGYVLERRPRGADVTSR
jgi:hypothetical protein